MGSKFCNEICRHLGGNSNAPPFESRSSATERPAVSIQLELESPVIRFHTFSGRNYSVEYSTNLHQGRWTALAGGNFPGIGRDMRVIDTNSPASTISRFYRVVQVQ